MTTAPGPLIEDLFHQGHPLDHIVDVGEEIGWTRDDVMAVLREQQWDLDGSGRLPRSKRSTAPRGLRHLPPESMKAKSPPVPDRLTGRPLPTEPPTPAEALAEQDELDVAIGDLDDIEGREPLPGRDYDLDDVQADAEDPDLEQAQPAPAKRKGGRPPKPIEHGTDDGYWQHKRKKEPIPGDDSCGCQAAHDATPTRTRRPAPAKATDEPQAPAGITLPTAKEIRAKVDKLQPRAKADGSINSAHVAIEQTLRARHGLPSYIPELDGPGKFLATAPLAPWEEALVADPFDPNDPRLAVAHTPTATRGPKPPPRPQHTGRDLDEWVAAAQRSSVPAIRKRAGVVVVALLQLRIVLDELDREERRAAWSTP